MWRQTYEVIDSASQAGTEQTVLVSGVFGRMPLGPLVLAPWALTTSQYMEFVGDY